MGFAKNTEEDNTMTTSTKDYSHIKPGMYVKTYEIKDNDECIAITRAFVASGATPEEGPRPCDFTRFTYDYNHFGYFGINNDNDTWFTDNSAAYGGELVTVDFILSSGTVTTQQTNTRDLDKALASITTTTTHKLTLMGQEFELADHELKELIDMLTRVYGEK